MKMLSTENSGKFIKSIWSYLFEDKEPRFESTELNYCFSLCKSKLDLSKERCISKTQNSKSTAIGRLTALNGVYIDNGKSLKSAQEDSDNVSEKETDENENQMSFDLLMTGNEMANK